MTLRIKPIWKNAKTPEREYPPSSWRDALIDCWEEAELVSVYGDNREQVLWKIPHFTIECCVSTCFGDFEVGAHIQRVKGTKKYIAPMCKRHNDKKEKLRFTLKSNYDNLLIRLPEIE